MLFARCRFLIVLIFAATLSSFGQKVNVSWKRILNIQQLYYEVNEEYFHDYSDIKPFSVLDFLVEIPLKNNHFSIGGEVVYSHYSGLKPEYYEKNDSYEKSLSFGVVSRYYTAPRVWRFYWELGIHANYLRNKELVIIPNYYGPYKRIIDQGQFALSGTIAAGFSLGNDKVRWEPYVQVGLISDIKDKGADSFYTGSIGMVKNNFGFIISPAVIKIGLF